MNGITVRMSLAVVALAVHGATASRYGYFRDELYFIACSHHLAWGYIDQPPLVALAAWFAQPFGYALPALRALPILTAALTVLTAVDLARILGGGIFARWSAGVLVLLLPAYLLLGNTLTTTSFEPLSWTLALYCAVRLIRSDGAWTWWLALALVFAFGLYGKYSIALLALALVVALLLTPQRRLLATPRFAAAVALALLLIAPNLLWQGAHGWPIFEVLRGDAAHRPAFQTGFALEYRSFFANALAFVIEQIVYTNPLVAPIWIAGIVASFCIGSLRDLRFVSIAVLLTLLFAILLGAKGYYVIGLYGTITAIGCTLLERLARGARMAIVAVGAAAGVVAMPLALPVLPVGALMAYTHSPHLVQPVFAEEFGWDRLARDVARVYFSLPARERARATIYADTYADAGALDFFGPRYHLPQAISSQNSYYIWGTHGDDGSVLVAIGATRIDILRHYYRSVTLVATSFDPYRWIVEGPAPIYICRDPVAPLAIIWPHLRWYGA